MRVKKLKPVGMDIRIHCCNEAKPVGVIEGVY